jgi:hypothetical protein
MPWQPTTLATNVPDHLNVATLLLLLPWQRVLLLQQTTHWQASQIFVTP